MTNPVRLTEEARGILLSSMSDASCAMTLGRSAAWVARMRLALTEAEPSRAEPRTAMPRRAVKTFPALPARVGRWVGWFLAAGWSPVETAHLFDLDPAHLAGMAR